MLSYARIDSGSEIVTFQPGQHLLLARSLLVSLQSLLTSKKNLCVAAMTARNRIKSFATSNRMLA